MTSDKRVLKRASPSTIQEKFLVGYQGWFSCVGDGEPIYPGHSGWLHWFNGDRPNLDVWPDVSSYSPSELFAARNLKLKNGEQAFLFSSRHPKTVQRHFHWMAEHGIDGAFLQRFAEQCQPGQENSIRRLRDEVGQRVREAAEKEGRVFAIMYDVSSVPADRIQHILEHDWIHLIRNVCILDSPNYLKEKGRPVIGLWGFGFHNRGHTPDLVRSIIKFFRTMTPGGAYIFGGAPSCWRLSQGDADRHPGFVDVWLHEFDAISPWTVGRYRNEEEAANFAESKMKGDMELIRRRNEETGRKLDYVPVVHPGGSGFNLSNGNWAFNDAPRVGGKFLWKQIFHAKRLGVRSVYGAMWDEYDEGTAFMPIVTHKRNLPQSDVYRFMALDEEGYDLPSDWYMRICGMAAEGLRSERWIHETFPLKELQDYWSSRPKYEEVDNHANETAAGPISSGSKPEDEEGGSGQASYQQWLSSQNVEKDEPPPPPYSLVAEETSAAPAVRNEQVQQVAAGPSPSTSASPYAHAAPATPPVSNTGDSISNATPTPSHSHATPPVSRPPPSDVGPALPSSLQNLPVSNRITPPLPVPSMPQTPYAQDRPNINLPISHLAPFTGTTSAGRLSPSPISNNIQGQDQQRRPSDPLASLSSDFARTNITGSPIGSPREDTSSVGPSTAVATPIAVGGRPNTTSPPPLHPAHPAANKPAGYGRPSVPRPQTAPQTYTPYRPNPAPPSPAMPAGAWSAAEWPPKEWGITPDAFPAPSGGANLGRLQTYGGSSGVNSGGANLRPSASVSVPPAIPTHTRPSTRPNTAGGGVSPKPPAHSPTTTSFPRPQSSASEYPPVGFPDMALHTPSPPLPGRYGSTPYHPGHAVSHSTHTASPRPPGSYGPVDYDSGPAASSSYHTPSHYYPYHHQHNVGGFMPSVGPSPPFHPHQPSFPHSSMPTPWMPTGPGMPVGPIGPVGPMGGLGPHSIHTGPLYPHPPQPGPQIIHVMPSDPRDTGIGPLNYALSAVDMVAGKKTRDQLQGLANKFMK